MVYLRSVPVRRNHMKTSPCLPSPPLTPCPFPTPKMDKAALDMPPTHPPSTCTRTQSHLLAVIDGIHLLLGCLQLLQNMVRQAPQSWHLVQAAALPPVTLQGKAPTPSLPAMQGHVKLHSAQTQAYSKLAQKCPATHLCADCALRLL